MSFTRDLLAGDGLLSAAVMAGMALVSVGLWTLRVTLAARGRKLLGAAAAAVEAVVFAVVFSSLAASLDAPARLIGYAVGVAAGTLLGLLIDERASRSTSEVQVVVHGRDRRAAQTLQQLGWPATSFAADGPDGPVTVTFVAVDDIDVGRVVDVLRREAPRAFWAVQPVRRMHPVPGPPFPPFRSQGGSHDRHQHRRPPRPARRSVG